MIVFENIFIQNAKTAVVGGAFSIVRGGELFFYRNVVFNNGSSGVLAKDIILYQVYIWRVEIRECTGSRI